VAREIVPACYYVLERVWCWNDSGAGIVYNNLLDSELWYCFGCRAAALASAAPWPLGSLFGSFHHAERAPRVISSLTAESPTIRSFKPILRADIGILTTRVLRARKTRKRAYQDRARRNTPQSAPPSRLHNRAGRRDHFFAYTAERCGYSCRRRFVCAISNHLGIRGRS
jgi:hypothetical protein